MPKRTSGFFDRVIRANRERMDHELKKELIREQEVGQCNECGNVYAWSKLQDESTQEYTYVICANCIAQRDPRAREL